MLQVDAQLLRPLINTLEKTTLPVWKLLEVEAPFLKSIMIALEKNTQELKPIMIALEKNTLGRIYDVMTVKADVTFNTLEILKGIFNVAVDYTLVHRDGTEEKATLLIKGRKESGHHVTSMEIIPKNNAVRPEKKIFFPVEIIFTCDWPSAHTFSVKGDFGKIFLNIANDRNEVSVRGVLEHLGQQYKYSTILSIREKYFTVTFQEPSKELYDAVMKVRMLNGFPRIEITGFVPTSRFFTAGVFKSELIVKSWYNYEIKHVFRGMEMLNLNIGILNGKMEMIMKYGQTHKTHIVMEYEYLRWIKILLPTTNTWLSKDLGVEIHYQPTNEAKQLEGGNIKIVAKRDNKPVMNIGGYYGLTLDSTKYEILL